MSDKAEIMAKAAGKRPAEMDAWESRSDGDRKNRIACVMGAAQKSGLLGEKSKRIGGRISGTLVEKAKKQTGIEADTDLIEFALASVALDDEFPASFRKTRGTVDPALKLGF